MKIKSLLIGMLASTAFVACTNDESPVNNEQAVGGKAENYLAVNIVMPGGVTNRVADANGFDEGTTAERTIDGAVFLFFDGDNNGCATPYYVSGNNLSWSDATGVGQDKEATVLVIENNKKQLPAYIVAILNPVGGENHGYTQATSLANLKASVDAYKTKGFVMSNSVYVGGNGKEVCATPITLDNIFSTADEAKAAPVTIPVERVVAKVSVTGLDTASKAWSTTEKYADNSEMGLKLVVTGWEVLQNTKSKLIKEINTAWNLGWTWNAPAYQRSYWAADYAVENGRTQYLVNEMTNLEAKYVEETVSQTPNLTWESETNTNPWLLVRGKFVDANNKEVELVEWRGQKYTLDGYLDLIIGNSKVAQYHTKTVAADGTITYNSIAKSALKMQDQANDWQSQAVLTDEAKAEDVQYCTLTYKPNGDVDGDTEVETTEVEAAIAQFGLVQYWNGGNTYYFTPIKHETVGQGVNAQNYYAVVRNHMYNITISSIEGFGTPVANPNQAIDKPEKPTDDQTYLAADVVVLKWKVVNQTVPLQ